MPKFLYIDNNGEMTDEIHDDAHDAEEWLKDQVESGKISASDAEDYEVFALDPRNLEVEVTINVSIS